VDQIYPDATLLAMLQDIVTTGGIDYHLFTNNVTPDLTFTLTSFVEAAWGGYAIQNVLPAAFTIQSVSGHVGTLIAAPVTFVNTSGSTQNAYGYFITRHSDGMFRGCARFDGAPAVILNGGSQQVIPILSDLSLLGS
jgi:hypothetical protein